MKWKVFCITIVSVIVVVQGLGPLDDPYKILGVHKSATLQDLRRAYKNLAKEWHPDKNDDPDAGNTFVKITKAYELLTDPDRRKLYDHRRVIDPDDYTRARWDYNFEHLDPFDDSSSGFPFPFNFPGIKPEVSVFHRLSITAKMFDTKLLPKSFTVPYLILFYSDWCFNCFDIEPTWRKLILELEPLGVEMATVHASRESVLAKKCSITSAPTLVMLLDGKIFQFKNANFKFQNVVDFMRREFPYRMVANVNDQNMNYFLNGWHDNRIRALIFQKTDILRLRYLLMAYYYRERVSFGFVRINSPNTIATQEKHRISPDTDTLLLFNENINRPVASLSMSVISTQTMKDVITANKYLILPRLSSQKMMDSVCPAEWKKPKKRLCIVLVSENTRDHEEPRQAMRQFAQESKYNAEKVRFSYIYREKQKDFFNAILTGIPEQTVFNVVILWRRDASHIKYEWLRGGWTHTRSSPIYNETKKRLESTITKLLRPEESLTHEAVIKELIDEHAQGLLGKIITKLLNSADFFRENIGRDHFLTIFSVIGTVAFIVLCGCVMAHLVRLEEEKIRASQLKVVEIPKSNSLVNFTPQLKLHELRFEKYNGMVRLLKPGCRTIVVLIDLQSRNKLLPVFHKMVWPYRKNKTLLFGFMFIHRGLDWYKRLLTLSLSEPRELKINPRNCVGTVLCLNGHRKYFCMYHTRYPECFQDRSTRRMRKITDTLGDKNNRNMRVGCFMGFDDTSDSDNERNVDVERADKADNDRYSNIVFEENLLDGLPNWLDRLFEGTTHRYYINYWPDFPTK